MMGLLLIAVAIVVLAAVYVAINAEPTTPVTPVVTRAPRKKRKPPTKITRTIR